MVSDRDDNYFINLKFVNQIEWKLMKPAGTKTLLDHNAGLRKDSKRINYSVQVTLECITKIGRNIVVVDD